MYDYYCKNCNNIVGKWNNKDKFYYGLFYCNFFNSKNNKLINFMNCKNCNKFVGIICHNVCKICFGKDEILGEKNLFNFFLKYKKLKFINFNCYCKICNKNDFRYQQWFFKELTFYK